jgi:hypothetical protein
MPNKPLATGWQRFTLSIGVKGLIVFVALIVFLGSVALFAVHQKNLLLASFAEIESILEGEAVLAQAHSSIFHAIGAISVNASAPAGDEWLRRIHMHQQLFLSQRSAVTGSVSVEPYPLQRLWPHSSQPGRTRRPTICKD